MAKNTIKLLKKRVLEVDKDGGYYMARSNGIAYDNVFSEGTGMVKAKPLRVLLDYSKGTPDILIGDRSQLTTTIKNKLQKYSSLEKESITNKAIEAVKALELEYIHDIFPGGIEIFTSLTVGKSSNRVLVIIYDAETRLGSLYSVILSLPRYTDESWEVRSISVGKFLPEALEFRRPNEIMYKDNLYTKAGNKRDNGVAKIICIEGVDGVGKQTQTELLKEYLVKQGKTVNTVSFPRYGNNMATGVEKYMRGDYSRDSSNHITNKQAAFLYAIDRMDWALEEYNKVKSKFDYIIIDRYTGSNMVHQSKNLLQEDGVYNEKEILKVAKYYENFEYNEVGLPKPDIQLFLNMSVNLVLESIRSRENNDGIKDDKLECNENYIVKSTEIASLIADEFRWKIIDCSTYGVRLSRELISSCIIDTLKQEGII